MACFKFQNKYTCGAYFNMARDNFYRTMMDILNKIGIKKNFTETELDNQLSIMLSVLKGEMLYKKNETANTLMLQQSRLRQMLFRSFPILGPIMTDIVQQHHLEKEVCEALSEEKRNEIIKIDDIEERRGKKSALVVDDGERDASCADCFEVMYVLGCCLTDCRNYFTHYKPYNSQEALKEMYERQKKVAEWLFPVFTASRRLDKQRKRLSSAEMEFITNKAYKIKTENGKRVKNDEGRDVYIKNHDYYFSIFGESFISRIDDKNYLQKDFEKRCANFGDADNFALSDFGLLYLCCCFITRPQTHVFVNEVSLFANSPENITDSDYDFVLGWSRIPSLDDKRKKDLLRLKKKLNIEDFDLTKEEDRAKVEKLKADINNRQNTLENIIIREMLSIYRIRLPKGNRLDKQDTKTTIALDMLNELRRCPKPVYDVLTTEGQSVFKDIVGNSSGDITETVDRIRHRDRFPYLALRIIDEANLLPNIRFQVQLGYYRFAFYDKSCVDGTTQLRRLGKTVNGFGKLAAIEAKRKLEWTPGEEEQESQVANKMQHKVYAPTLLEDGETVLDLQRPVEDQVANKPYITDSTAYYNIHNNRIGLYWKKNGEKFENNDVLVFPTLNAIDIDNKGRRKVDVPQQAPLCSLSVRDLPALLFLCYLNGHRGNIVEQIIIDKYNGLKQFFTDISRVPIEENEGPTLDTLRYDVERTDLEAVLSSKRYGLKISEIPVRIKEILLSTSMTFDIVGYFRGLLSDTKYALNDSASAESIRNLIYEVGFSECTKGLPQKYWKKIDRELCIRQGIETLLKCKGKTLEDLPQNVEEFVFNSETTDNKTIVQNPTTVRFLELLLGKKDQDVGRIEHRLQEVEHLLKKFNEACQRQFTKANRYGTKSYKDVRYAKLAEILAESMVKWQPTVKTENPIWRGKNKLTSLNYRRMVDFLSTYSSASVIGDQRGLEALKSLFREAGFVCSNTPHPFILKVLDNDPKNIEELYLYYFQQEKKELVKLIAELKKNSKDSPVEKLQDRLPAFVHPYRERWTIDVREADQIRQMAANYLKAGTTLLLPDGLFTDAIIEKLKQNHHNIVEEALNVEKNKNNELSRNVSFFISKYLEEIDDHCQSFYDADRELFYRDYDLFKKLGVKPLSREQISKKLKDKRTLEGTERDYARIKKNERTILRYKTQDIVLFLTAKKILQTQLELQKNTISNNDTSHRTNLGNSTEQALNHLTEKTLAQKEKIQSMKLKDVFDGEALNVTMDYEYVKTIKWKSRDEKGRVVKFNKQGQAIPFDENDNPIEKGGQPKVFERKIYITQNNIAIKNFGRIFRVINDERLDELLVLLVVKREGVNPDVSKVIPVYTVSVAELANEFEQFDRKRAHAFEIIHGLEKAAYPHLANSQSGETFQFKNMMRLICSEEETNVINQYRVSFTHSKYGVNADAFGKGVVLEIPLVSGIMEEEMQRHSEEIINKNETKGGGE